MYICMIIPGKTEGQVIVFRETILFIPVEKAEALRRVFL